MESEFVGFVRASALAADVWIGGSEGVRDLIDPRPPHEAKVALETECAHQHHQETAEGEKVVDLQGRHHHGDAER